MAAETETVNLEEEVTTESSKEDIPNKNNGDTNAAITLKLPVKKSEAKTEKKVEIVKNSLPDGSIQEVKTTTTKTTIDGKTEITTETETTTFPKDCSEDDEYEIVEEEEEEESSEKEVVQNESAPKSAPISEKISTITEKKETIQVNGKTEDEEDKENNKGASDKDGQIITQHEKHESSTTKKVVIIQSETQNSDEENEEDYVNDSDNVDVEEVVLLETTAKTDKKEEITKCDEQKIENKVIGSDDVGNEPENTKLKENENEEIEDDEEYEEVEEEEEEVVEQRQELTKKENDHHPEPRLDQNTERVEEKFEEAEEADEFEEAKINEKLKPALEEQNVTQPIDSKLDEKNGNEKQTVDEDKTEDETKSEVKEIPIQILHETKVEEKVQKPTENIKSEKSLPPIINISSTEPSVPLEKVEEVEIKPIGLPKEVITKTQTEIITTTTDNPVTHSTQTEYNVIQNIVTVNRTTKALDHAYEEIPDNNSIIKTFEPPPLEGNFKSSQPVFKPYQASFTPEPQTERRHSLLLERISVERQIPPEIYQNNYQTSNQIYEDRHYLEEPQSEILTVSNVKPSTISKNQQWYQRNETDNQSSTLQSSDTFKNQNLNDQSYFKPQTQSQPFYKPKTQTQSASQTIYQPQIRVQPSPQPTYLPSTPVQSKPQPLHHSQPQTQPIYQPQPTSQPLYQTQPQSKSNVQPIYHPQPQYQQSYVDNSSQESYTSTSNKYEYNTYPSYTSKPIWAGKSFDSQPLSSSLSNQSSYLQKDSTESFEKSYQQQSSSSYVPPPWEQDPNYAVNNSTLNFYQPTPCKTTFKHNTDWNPSKPTPKFSKPTSTAYIPPAPNQSFVKPVNTSEIPRQQGRKTYYSEYERRYISVPETTYIPNETKFQPQPDPSPQYYYDNNEPVEVVEPQWRKELREFKEQTSKTTIQTEQTTVRPPWEDDPKYATPKDFTPTPTWTQTVKPRSWRERSFEPEYIGSQEWPKTNTLGRGRPQSSYVKNTFDRVPDRTRGVSVDRYNPNNYQSPLTREHPPPASHILDPIVQGKTYHNPNVPAYHSRASVEPREQPVTYQQPRHRESRAAPVQSRSFKYLQWITGTDD